MNNILDPTANFARVAVAFSYGSTSVTIALSSGEGARLPQPSTDGEFNLSWWDSKKYPIISEDPKKEIVRVTARSGDTLTIIRGQEGTTASSKNTAGGEYKMILTPTKKTIDDIDETFLGWNKYTKVIPTRASADDPTYVLTFAGVDLTDKVSLGMKIKWTQNSTVRYGFVTKISFSTNTTLTLYGGTDYDVEDTSTHAISNVYFSHHKAPLNFPLNPDKWSILIEDTNNLVQATPSSNVVYNMNKNLVAPIGQWQVYIKALPDAYSSAAGWFYPYCALSTSNNSMSHKQLEIGGGSQSVTTTRSIGSAQIILDFTTKTTLYLVARVQTSVAISALRVLGGDSVTVLKATITYL